MANKPVDIATVPWVDTVDALVGRERSKSLIYFPDDGPLRRELYPRSLAFFKHGKDFPERLFLAANRIGKTESAGFEIAAHLTGRYPTWWEGRRFAGPTKWWVAGDTAKTTMDVPQLCLFGSKEDPYCGMVPKDLIWDSTKKSGTTGALDSVWLKHVSGNKSHSQFKSYDQGRRAFEGTAKDGVWLDEEPPDDVEVECLLRLMTTDGMMIITFTPLQGLTSFLLRWLEQAAMVDEAGAIVRATAILKAAQGGRKG